MLKEITEGTHSFHLSVITSTCLSETTVHSPGGGQVFLQEAVNTLQFYTGINQLSMREMPPTPTCKTEHLPLPHFYLAFGGCFIPNHADGASSNPAALLFEGLLQMHHILIKHPALKGNLNGTTSCLLHSCTLKFYIMSMLSTSYFHKQLRQTT